MLDELPRQTKQSSPAPSYKNEPKKTKNPAGFDAFCASLGEGVMVEHQRFGIGVVLAMNQDQITVKFGEVQKTFLLRILYERNLLREL